MSAQVGNTQLRAQDGHERAQNGYKPTLPDDAASRERYPMAEGLLYYFGAALAAVSEVSRIGNEQHNPGQPMHWARGKSTNHADKIVRHLLDAGTVDSQGVRHSARLAWRALALLEEEIEREEGAPLPRNARLPQPAKLDVLRPVVAVHAAAEIPPHAPDAVVEQLLPPGSSAGEE